MYQDSIEKGSKVTSAEMKPITALNITGSSYDMALNEMVFLLSQIKVLQELLRIIIQELEILEWVKMELYKIPMKTVHAAYNRFRRATSTNSNLDSFTDIFTQIAGNQIVQYTNKVETYAAKMSDYSASAVGDSSELSGSGVKSQSAKISDIEALITTYSTALEAFAVDPEATSSPSIAQSNAIDFPDSQLSTIGNQICLHKMGSKITQNS